MISLKHFLEVNFLLLLVLIGYVIEDVRIKICVDMLQNLTMFAIILVIEILFPDLLFDKAHFNKIIPFINLFL